MAGCERLLSALLDRSRLSPPDRLPELAADLARAVGAADLVVYVVDHEQAVLVPLPSACGVAEPLGVDATLAGRAYLSEEPQDGDAGGGRRLWLPLVDGADRLGVVGVTVERADAETLRRCADLAAGVAQLLVTQGQYTDAYVVARRRKAMSLAAEMQWQLLPPLTFSDRSTTISGLLQPAYDVGGDAFDYAVGGDRADLAILDPVGHGLVSSLLASLAVGAYRHSRRAGSGLADTYVAMADAVADHLGDERFITAQLARLDRALGQLRWLNAGHPPPLLLRQHKVVGTLECEPCLPIGLGGEPGEVATAWLEPGDRVLFYTDGVVEAHPEGGEPFGEERLADLLARASTDGYGTAETMRRLSHAVAAHWGREPTDDATMLFLEWRGGPSGG